MAKNCLSDDQSFFGHSKFFLGWAVKHFEGSYMIKTLGLLWLKMSGNNVLNMDAKKLSYNVKVIGSWMAMFWHGVTKFYAVGWMLKSWE